MALKTGEAEITQTTEVASINPDKQDRIGSMNKNTPSIGYTTLLQDIRTRSAKRFYNRNKKGVLRVYKTARAGATTTLEIASYLLHEKVVLIEPTNKIIDETVKADVEVIFKEIPEIKQPRIIHVQPNHKCEFYIRDKIEAKEPVKAIKAATEVARKVMNEAKEDEYKASKAEYETLQTLSLIHISEPTRRTPISYAVFCLKKK